MAIFVIQKHYARRLHYDLRLEMNGVLKSWAIPKVPPRKEGIKRLAIPTEDHELDYADFEGEIPEGTYGAGKVEIWDKGEYEMDEKEEGKFAFYLNGKKLKGRYCLLKFKDEDKWLFFKC
ncbi:MAG TPA: 3'-phosphoesterase [Thermoplasmata archaeon]|nr:3'-phosphoesterase [Thermoplasmata archaeon]